MDNSDSFLMFESITNNKTYQTQVLCIACLIWGFLDVFSLTLGLLEVRPEIMTSINGIPLNKTLTYEDCANNNYTLSDNQVGYSIIIYFNIYCNRLLVALIGSVNFMGVFCGTLIAPTLLDKLGRVKPILGSLIMFIFVLFLSIQTRNIIMFLICIFFVGFFNLIAHISVYILMNEITRKEKRSFYSVLMFNSYAVFGIFFTGMYYCFDDWKKVFYLTIFFCLIIFVLAFKYLEESPRYLLVKGDVNFMESMHKKIYIYNKENDAKYFVDLLSNKRTRKELLNEDIKYGEKLINNNKSSDSSFSEYYNQIKKETIPNNYLESESYLTLFKNKKIRTVFLVMCFLWFTVSGTYYGIAIYIKELPGNIYLNLTIMYIFEVFSNFLSAFMINNQNLGRKNSLIILYFICIILLLLIVFIDRNSVFQNVFTLAFRFFLSTMYNINYVYSAEYYPTVLRAKGLAFNTLLGRFGAIISPFLVEIFEFKYFLFCLIITIISFILSFLLKETYNTELKNFVEDGNNE